MAETGNIWSEVHPIVDSVFKGSDTIPRAPGGGYVDWFYELAMKLYAVVGNEDIVYGSSAVTGTDESGAGSCVAFTRTTVVLADFSADGSSVARSWSRGSLTDLSVSSLSLPPSDFGYYWPEDLRVELVYPSARLNLPLSEKLVDRQALFELLLGLRSDLT